MIRIYQKLPGFTILLACLGSGTVSAQGNHCVAQKSPVKMAVAAGQSVYAANCQSCHQADGAGLQDKNPALIKSGEITGDKNKLIELLIRGRAGSPAAQEKKYEQAMPVYAGLSDEEMANLATYIRRSFGNKASLVKPGEVKKIRMAIK